MNLKTPLRTFAYWWSHCLMKRLKRLRLKRLKKEYNTKMFMSMTSKSSQTGQIVVQLVKFRPKGCTFISHVCLN